MPDTANYMMIGYAIALGILALLVLSIWWRYRTLAADELALHTLEQEATRREAVSSRTDNREPARVN